MTIDVLHVSRFFHPHVGGTENFVADLASATRDHGVRSSVLASRRYADDQGPPPAVPVHRLPVVGFDAMPLPVGGFGQVASLVGAADVVHVHDLRFLLEPVVALAKLRRTPLALTTHGLIFHTQRLRAAKLAAWHSYYRALLGRFDVIACSSSQDLSYCLRAGLHNARLLTNPVAIDGFAGVERARPREGALIYFGRLAPNKGLERLASLLDADQRFTLTIVGSAAPAYVAALERSLGHADRVRFLGALSNEELYRELAVHACAVLPSRAEGFGLTLVEALASGIPVVASDIPSYREIAAGSPVRLVDFDSAEHAAAAIHDGVGAWDAEAAKRRAAGFSWRERANDFAALYTSLVAG
jgi:alpha-1,3-mannosyltransferase